MSETTSSTMPETLQGFFDIAWNHAVVKKEPPSFREKHEEGVLSPKGILCLYRGRNGERCLIGAAIPDDKYRGSIEGCSVLAAFTDLDLETGSATFQQLGDLQNCHDDAILNGSVSNYHVEVEERLRRFAEKYGLVIPCE